MLLCVGHFPEMCVLVCDKNAAWVCTSCAFDADNVHMCFETSDIRLSLAEHRSLQITATHSTK